MPGHDGLRISPLRGDALKFHGRAAGDSTWLYFYAKHRNIADKQTACPLIGSDRAGTFSAMRPVI